MTNFDTSRSTTCNQPENDNNDDVVQLGSNQLRDEPESNTIVKRLRRRLPALAQTCDRHGDSDRAAAVLQD